MSKSAKYYCDMEAIKEDSVDPIGTESGKRNKRSVWTISTQPYKEAHFATFPESLIEPCVLAGCPKDGIVLDPFMGAGTTAVVSLKNDRRYVGIELNSEYIKIAEKRVLKVKRITDSRKRLEKWIKYY